jgi:hypothetical protein
VQQAVAAPWNDGLEGAPSPGQRRLQQHLVVPLETVEDREGRLDPLAHGPSLQELEARDAVAVEGDDLAAEDEGAAGQRLQGPGDLAELRGDVVAGA